VPLQPAAPAVLLPHAAREAQASPGTFEGRQKMAGGKRTARQAAGAGRALEAEARQAHRRQAEANGAFNARTVSLPAPWPPGPQRRVARAQRGG
jgi:hypothetical protein